MLRHGSRPPLTTLFVLACGLLAATGAASDSAPQVRYPDPDIGVDTLAARKKAQADTVDQFKVFYGFHFTDEIRKSGITFVNRVVDDAAIDYKDGSTTITATVSR